MAQREGAQQTERQASEGSDSDEESRLVEINLVRDSQEPLSCETCGKLMTEDDDGGYRVCMSCFGPQPGECAADYARDEYSYGVDEEGTVWSGMPDNPEPQCVAEDLPIWSMHPYDPAFKQFPTSRFEEQLALMHAGMTAGEPLSYECFVCSQMHTYVRKKDQCFIP